MKTPSEGHRGIFRLLQGGQVSAERNVPNVLSGLEISDAEKALLNLYESVALVRGLAPPPIFFRVAILGSGQVVEGHPVYDAAFRLARKLGMAGIDTVQGDGPGVMDAAARGTKEAQKENPVLSYGLPIAFQAEQSRNGHSDKKTEHGVFGTRLDHFDLLSLAQVLFDGGVGTLYELMAFWQPKTRPLKVGHNQNSPLILVGDMWPKIIDTLRREMVEREYIQPHEMDFLTLVPTEEEAFPIIMGAHEKFKLRKAAG